MGSKCKQCPLAERRLCDVDEFRLMLAQPEACTHDGACVVRMFEQVQPWIAPLINNRAIANPQARTAIPFDEIRDIIQHKT